MATTTDERTAENPVSIDADCSIVGWIHTSPIWALIVLGAIALDFSLMRGDQLLGQWLAAMQLPWALNVLRKRYRSMTLLVVSMLSHAIWITLLVRWSNQ